MTAPDNQFILTCKRVWKYSFIALCLRLSPIILAIPFYHLFHHGYVICFIFVWLYLAFLQAISLITRRDPAILVRIDMYGIILNEYKELKLRKNIFYSWEDIDSCCIRRWMEKEKSRKNLPKYYTGYSGETIIMLRLKNGCRHYYNLSKSIGYSRDESILLRIILIANIYRFSKGSVKWFIIPDKYDKYTLK